MQRVVLTRALLNELNRCDRSFVMSIFHHELDNEHLSEHGDGGASKKASLEMQRAIVEDGENVRRIADSVGGIIECRIRGVMAGLGDPVFDKLDATLSRAIMSIGGVKGIEFGSGFESARMRGSANNDPMRIVDGRPAFLSNNAGGILGGISTGEDIVIRIAVKPTPSISREQLTITDDGRDASISVKGRHDPSILPRAVPVVEAMAALTIADHMLVQRAYGR